MRPLRKKEQARRRVARAAAALPRPPPRPPPRELLGQRVHDADPASPRGQAGPSARAGDDRRVPGAAAPVAPVVARGAPRPLRRRRRRHQRPHAVATPVQRVDPGGAAAARGVQGPRGPPALVLLVLLLVVVLMLLLLLLLLLLVVGSVVTVVVVVAAVGAVAEEDERRQRRAPGGRSGPEGAWRPRRVRPEQTRGGALPVVVAVVAHEERGRVTLAGVVALAPYLCCCWQRRTTGERARLTPTPTPTLTPTPAAARPRPSDKDGPRDVTAARRPRRC